jgi:hypothetical protein
MLGGDDSHFVFRQKVQGEDGSVRRDVAMVKQAGLFSQKVGARFNAFAAKRRSRTRNYSQFGVLGPVLRATTSSV